jgi:NAD(P)-dependent dehydrogenase (short-subunit alcohol dehydrogenase family)
VTEAASGVDLELARILYSRNATVYAAARSSTRVDTDIKAIQAAHPSSKGRLEPFVIDLADLETVKLAVTRLLEKKLHMLVHNAGVMTPSAEGRTKHASS